ncbi:MAG: hypothetical protein P8H37_02125 [Paracoccaceae bacterium]|nr:hypothetical protein [Paracoccaceae bacterium]
MRCLLTVWETSVGLQLGQIPKIESLRRMKALFIEAENAGMPGSGAV